MAEHSRPRGITTITRKDWEEIYYAVEDKKLLSPTVQGDKKWIAHLNRILYAIGPDGTIAADGLENLIAEAQNG